GAPQASGVSAGGSDAKAAKVTAGPMFDPKGGILLALGSLYAPGQVKFAVAYFTTTGKTAASPGTLATIPVQIPADAAEGTVYNPKLLNVTMKDSLTADIAVETLGASITVAGNAPAPPSTQPTLSVTDASGSTTLSVRAGDTVPLEVRADSALLDLSAVELVLDFAQKTPDGAPDITGQAAGSTGTAVKLDLGSIFDLDGATYTPPLGNTIAAGRLKAVLAYLKDGVGANGPGSIIKIPVVIPATAALGTRYIVKLTDLSLRDSFDVETAATLKESSITVTSTAPPASTDPKACPLILSSAVAKPGADATLSLSATSATALAGATVTLQYDPSVLIFKGATVPSDTILPNPSGHEVHLVVNKDLSIDGNPAPAGKKWIRIIAVDSNGCTENSSGPLFNVTFTVASAVANGTSPITFVTQGGVTQDLVFADSKGTQLPATDLRPGSVTINADVPPPVKDPIGSITLEKVTATPGAIVSVPISVTSYTFMAGDLQVDYSKAPADAPVLKALGTDVVGTLTATLTGIENLATLGIAGFAFFGTSEVKGPGTLYRVKFQVNSTAKPGTVYPLSFSKAEIGAPDGQILPLTMVAGAITIVEGDKTLPTVSIKTPAENALVKGDLSIQIDASDTGTGVAKVEISTVEGGYQQSATAAPYAFLMKKGTLKDGKWNLVAKATDGAGNVGTSRIVPVTLDTTAPKLEATGVTSGAVITGTVTLLCTATDALSGVAKVAVTADGSVTVLKDATTAGADGKYRLALDTTALSDGPHTLHVIATDKAGNDQTLDLPVVSDNTAPTVAITLPLAGAVIRGMVPVRGAASDAGSFDSYVLEYGSGNAPTGFTQITSSSTAISNAKLADWDVSKLAAGDYTLRLTAKDKVGKLASTSVKVTVRNVKPGDMNGDGNLNVMDVVTLLRIVAGLVQGTDQQIAAGDVNGDGKVDVRDVVKALRIVALIDR
ncbi:MAG TPA: Ig-like domain-containing protein, partial [Armatimonadota bacterium]